MFKIQNYDVTLVFVSLVVHLCLALAKKTILFYFKITLSISKIAIRYKLLIYLSVFAVYAADSPMNSSSRP